MTRIAAALREAAGRLAGTSDTPRLDAELLLAHALGTTREAMLLAGGEGAVPVAFAALVDRRLAGEPIAYITGLRAFWTIELAVDPSVLIPRPDSETLIEAALAHFGIRRPATVLDLGTGSGALLLAALAEWPAARGVGVDRSAPALGVARKNAARLGMANRAAFLRGDWADAIAASFDLVLCNPPYVEASACLPRDVAGYEPASALYAGADGLDAYRRLVPQMRRVIGSGGCAALEIGSGQGSAVLALLERAELVGSIMHDLGGRDRCVLIPG